MSAKKRDFFTIVWDFFCSLKLTVTTLILLAVTSIIGTVVQQNRSPEEYLQEYSEGVYRLLSALNFFDMYHSWWFLALLTLFSINLICCSLNRLPRVIKAVREPVTVAGDDLFRTLSNVEEVTTRRPVDAVRERLEAALGKHFAPPMVTEVDGTVHLFAQKGAWSRFGVYITHASILIIFLGAIIGSLFGYKGYVNIVEGGEVSQVWLRGANKPHDLGFTVACEKFWVEYYGKSNRPSKFASILTVTDPTAKDQNKVPRQREVIVNDPLTYRGITFYQSSYGPAGDPVFSLRVLDRKSGESAEVTARQGQRVPLSGGGAFRVVDFDPNYKGFGLAAAVELIPAEGKGSPGRILLYQQAPDFDTRRGGEQVFTLLGHTQKQYTGLQVAKDPGVWVVWTGCLMLVLGSMAAFFLSHRRIWVTIVPLENRTGIKVGGSAHRNQPAFEIFFDELKKNLKAELEA